MNIDLETLKKIHKVYDLMTVKNNDEAYDLLGKILQEKQFILPVVVHTLKDCLIAQQPVEYKNKKHYLTTLEIMDSGEEICELMNTDTYEVISNVNGEEVKIF
tara:strand:+ start:997 stop:1305 length:309 start_codon:yes stop_codon:yes gene_type:complete